MNKSSSKTACVKLAQISHEPSRTPELNIYYYCNERLKLQCGHPDWAEVLDVKRFNQVLEHSMLVINIWQGWSAPKWGKAISHFSPPFTVGGKPTVSEAAADSLPQPPSLLSKAVWPTQLDSLSNAACWQEWTIDNTLPGKGQTTWRMPSN